jgi:hypothetical protein
VSVAVTDAPGCTLVALTVIVGAVDTLNVRLEDVPPPGAGENTLTAAVPATATSDAEIAACSCVALMKVVGRADPFQRTLDDEAKPLPLTVKVKAGAPAGTLDGDSDVTDGAGLTDVSTVTVGLVAAIV